MPLEKITDAQDFKDVWTNSCVVYVDKAYWKRPLQMLAKSSSVNLAKYKQNNMKGKNFDLNRYYT